MLETAEYVAGSGKLSFELGLDSHPTYRVVPIDSSGEEGVAGQLVGGSPFSSAMSMTPGEALLNEDTGVLFTIGIADHAGLDTMVELVPLDAAGNALPTLVGFIDDWEEAGGDLIAGDGSYSATQQLVDSEVLVRSFRCSLSYESAFGWRSVMSNSASFLFYEGMGLDRAEEIATFAAQVQADLDLLAETMEVSLAAQQVLDLLNVELDIPAAGLAESGEGVWWFTSEGIACAATVYEEGVILVHP